MPRRREAVALTGPREGQVGKIVSMDGEFGQPGTTAFVQFNDCRRRGEEDPDVHMLLPGEWERVKRN
jgi:hypothetical protein